MRFDRTLIALSLLAASAGCDAPQDGGREAGQEMRPSPAEVADPMAVFARMLPGEWRFTLTSQEVARSWTWGPGKHSIRTNELELFYWHPGYKAIRMLSLHAFIPGIGRGSGEGTFRFDGETAEGVLDLYQPPSLRTLGVRWKFDGPDKYHDVLLEQSGSAGMRPLAEWDLFRVPERAETPPAATEQAPQPTEQLKAFAPFLGRTYTTTDDPSAGDALRLRSTVAWVPDYVYTSVIASSGDGGPGHLLDAYVYHHVGTGAVRCLALSQRGGVYSGDVTVLAHGGLQLDLTGYEGDRVVPFVVRFELEGDRSVRQRVWSLAGAGRTLLSDIRHTPVESKSD